MTSPSAGRADTTLAFVAAAVGWAILEVGLRGGSVAELAIATGAAAALGLVHGLVWTAAMLLPARLAPAWRRRAYVVLALVLALLLASSLDAWARLGTRNQGLALAAIAAGLVAGGSAALLALAFGRVRDDGTPSWRHAGARTRMLAAAALLLAAVIASWLDRHAFPGLHAPAHSALRTASLAGLAFAVLLLARLHARAPWDRVALGLAVALAAVPFFSLRADAALPAVWATPVADEGLAMLRRAGDVDGDGASAWLGGGDCAPWDPEIHPAAIEIAGNGIDDNCRDGDAAVGAVRIADVPIPQAPAKRSVLLVTIETLRADRMGLSGYARDTTPMLVARAADARVFERAYTAGAWTSIAIPALLRGVQARRLQWQPWRETTRGRLVAPGAALELGEGEQPLQVFMLPSGGPPPLAFWLQRRGMTTAAVVDDRFSELLDPTTGIAEGFDTFVDADQIRGRDPDDRVVDLAIDTLRGLPRERPLFMWVHLFGPHSPNTFHEGVPTFGDGIGDGYDHEIRFVDAQLDRLLAAAVAELPELVWIVTADHGEALLAGDRMHGFDLGEGVVHVPLVVGGAGVPAGRVAAPVSTLDLVPTILALTDTPAPPWLDGVDLLAPAGVPDERVLLVDTWHRGPDGALLFDQTAATDGRHELVFEITKNAWGLADLRDPNRPPDQVLAGFDPEPWRTTIRAYLEAGPLAVEP